MNPPTASELFMTVWSQAIHGEESPKPGDVEWGNAARAHWARVWLECRDLARMLNAGTNVGATLVREAEASEVEPWRVE